MNGQGRGRGQSSLVILVAGNEWVLADCPPCSTAQHRTVRRLPALGEAPPVTPWREQAWRGQSSLARRGEGPGMTGKPFQALHTPQSRLSLSVLHSGFLIIELVASIEKLGDFI